MGVPAEVNTEISASCMEGVVSLRTNEVMTDRINKGAENRKDTVEEYTFETFQRECRAYSARNVVQVTYNSVACSSILLA